MKTVTLPSGEVIPAFGQGTWRMGEKRENRAAEVAALRRGLDVGATVIDTAEMYAEGGAEEVVAEALNGRRGQAFVVSKVYPHNASASGAIAACERSLKRLATDRIDLYLLHWRGSVPLAETVGAFERLRKDGKVRYWGVSNFDSADMAELSRIEGGGHCASNQVMYHLGERGIEWRLLAEEQKAGRVLMAYSPIGDGRILKDPTLKEVGSKHGVGPAAVALAFLLARPGVMVIPKTASVARVDENIRAVDLKLDAADHAALDRAFPKPTGPKPLAMS